MLSGQALRALHDLKRCLVNPVLMGILIFLALGCLAWTMFRRLMPLLAMKPEVRWDRPWVRLSRMFAYGIGQLRFFRRFELINGIAHVLIFGGTLVVTINTLHVIGRGFVDHWSLPGFHDTPLALFYAFSKSLFTLSIILGTLLALGIRIIRKPERMILSLEANLILAWICTMMVLDVIYEGTLFMIHPGHPDQQAAFMGLLVMRLLEGLGYSGNASVTASLYAVGFWGHIVMAFLFLNYLPYCKQFHEITSQPNIFFKDLKEKGEKIEAAKKKLDREALVMSNEMRAEKEREIRISINDFKSLQKQYMADFKEQEKKLVSRIQNELLKIVSQIGKKEGFLLILERRESGIIYSPDTIDISDRVIQEYNAVFAKKNNEKKD